MIWFSRTKRILLLCFWVTCSTAYSQNFKVIGYIPYYRFQLVDEFEFDKVTHVNLAFANPDMEGNLSVGGRNINPVVSAAHDHNVKVFLSLAGGALTSSWAAAWRHLMMEENRSDFIHKIMQFSLLHELDGIDMDLEWSHVDELYSGFVLELRDSVDVYGFELTAALPGTYRYPDINAEALAAFDWINMMVYDLRGPWDPDNPGPHSPLSFAHSSINYWEGQGVSSDRLTLGLPFYGYDFTDKNDVHALTYNQIVHIDSLNAYRDQDGAIYYNGIPTIEIKTQLAIDELSGIMMWELGQDHFGEYSLLAAVDAVVQTNTSGIVEETKVDFLIYPNPFSDYLNFYSANKINGELRVYSVTGALVYARDKISIEHTKIELTHLPAGSYILQVIAPSTMTSRKIIKR